MAALTAAQHDQLRRWIKNILPYSGPKQDDIQPPVRSRKGSVNPQRGSALRAFAALGLSNLSAFAFLYWVARAAVRNVTMKAALSTDAVMGRQLSNAPPALPARGSAMELAYKTAVADAVGWWLARLAVNWEAVRSGYVWRLITSSFVHLDSKHLIGSLVGIYQVAWPCARIPGMNAWHVGAITVGSSIFSSLIGLIQHAHFLRIIPCPTPTDSVCYGASGVVSAFMIVAAMGRPWDRVGVGFGGQTAITMPNCVYGGLHILHNCGSLAILLGFLGRRNMVPANIGYATHLGGAAFGAIYYTMVFQPPTSRTRIKQAHRSSELQSKPASKSCSPIFSAKGSGRMSHRLVTVMRSRCRKCAVHTPKLVRKQPTATDRSRKPTETNPVDPDPVEDFMKTLRQSFPAHRGYTMHSFESPSRAAQ
ncbi:unnamed protein product [Zymoseptoria tritici ST99CH_3D1]|nr:unnamed protein product [Zymoseptoria tritici ST99CH_3D1]